MLLEGYEVTRPRGGVAGCMRRMDGARPREPVTGIVRLRLRGVTLALVQGGT
jgi:hypothetical protein